MERKITSKGGKRLLRTKKRKRAAALLLAGAMLASMVSLDWIVAGAAQATEADKNQVLDAGGTLFYDENGAPVPLVNGQPTTSYAVSVGKRVSQLKENGTPIENKFKVDLTVAVSAIIGTDSTPAYLPNVVTDQVPAPFHVDSLSGKAVANGTAAVDASGVVSWTFSQLPPDNAGYGSCTYKLSYTMTLDNIAANYVGGVAQYAVNTAAPQFQFQSCDAQGTAIGPMRQVPFANTGMVKCYAANYSFYKVDPSGAAIQSGEESEHGIFQLYRTMQGDWSGGRDIHNDATGKVTFTSIPSGHSYKLKESKPPLGYAMDGVEHSVTVSWGVVTEQLSDGKLKNLHDTAEKTVIVRKFWQDDSDFYKTYPVAFEIRCKLGDTVVKTVTGNIQPPSTMSKTWETTVTIPTKDANSGDGLTHEIVETNTHQRFTVSVTNGDGLFTITNKVAPVTQTINVVKLWVDPVTQFQSQEPETEPLPAAEAPVSGEPVAGEPVPGEPVPGEPVTGDPVAEDVDSDVADSGQPDGAPPQSSNGLSDPTQGEVLAVNSHPDVTVRLIQRLNGTSVEFASVTLSDPTGTGRAAYSFTGVPISDALGQKYSYTVTEDAVPGYYQEKIEIDQATNTYTFINKKSEAGEPIEITFHKHWSGEDGGNDGGNRKPIVMVLYANGSAVSEAGVTLTKANALPNNPDVWAYTFDRLMAVDGNGTPIEYTVREKDVPEGYLGDNPTGSSIDIVNTWNQTNLTVYKTWVKPDGVTPPPVTFRLLQDGAEIDHYELQPDEDSYTFPAQPIRTSNGHLYTYTVTEDAVAGYTSAHTGTSFTNTIIDPNDAIVTGDILWELRGEPESVLPQQVTVQLYVGTTPVDGKTAVVTKAGNWAYSFGDLPRYTSNGSAVVEYSVRELGQTEADGPYTKPAPDQSTIMLNNTSFGAHYFAVTEDANNPFHYTAKIRNHTNAELLEYVGRIDKVYDHYIDGRLVASELAHGDQDARIQAFDLSFNTGDYAVYGGKTYTFQSGQVQIGDTSAGVALPDIVSGANTVRIAQMDGIYVVTLYYELRETTPVNPGGGGDDGGGEVRPTPVPSSTPATSPTGSPSASPSTSPGASPSPSPGMSTSPVPSPAPTATPAATPSPVPSPVATPPPDPRPTNRPLTPEEQERVDEVVDEVTRNPDLIIRDPGILEELYPELDLEDIPIPLYWGPDFAIIEGPNGELIVIDSDLVPLGALPQTGTFPIDTDQWLRWAAMLTIASAAGMAFYLFLRRGEDEE